nr:hypothetical protein [Tanacetum cinerariifolium]
MYDSSLTLLKNSVVHTTFHVVERTNHKDYSTGHNQKELDAHYMYMAQIQEVTPDTANNSRPIFDAEPLQKVQNNDDIYNVFAIDHVHPEQHESINDTHLEEQGNTNITIDSLDMC